MKIVAAKVIVTCPDRNFVTLKLTTDDGLTGVGDATLNGRELAVASYLRDHVCQLLIGRDAGRIEDTWQYLHKGAYWRRGPVTMTAIAAVDTALWDLAGKALGAPVATLLGGSAERIAAYASLGELRPPGQRADDAHALVAAGFRAVKVRIARDRVDEGVAVVAAIRAAVGDALEIMVDLNQWWRMAGDIAPGLGPQAARRVIDRLAEHDVLWVEEPLAGDDLQGMAMLRAQTGVRIAGGEMARGFDELRRALDADALDVVQPDVVLALGISGARTLAELALRRNRWFAPHTWTNGIGVLANLHVCCGVGGGPFLEFPYDPPGWTPERRDFMLAEPVRIHADGMLAVGTAPGLGIELDEDAVAHYRRAAA
jgi:D-galactarolactone cycloisomerase